MANALPLDNDEQIVRINKMQADINKVQAETRWLPWQIVISAALATAALLGAGAALAKLFFP
jgi:hypothetical protein